MYRLEVVRNHTTSMLPILGKTFLQRTLKQISYSYQMLAAEAVDVLARAFSVATCSAFHGVSFRLLRPGAYFKIPTKA